MILAREPAEVTIWLLAFQRQSQHWWARWLPGEFKHVAAFAWVPAMQTWVVYDVSLDRTTVALLPGDAAAQEWIAARTVGGALLKLAVQAGRASRLRLGFWCVPAVKHLLGLRSGALLPTALWRDCLRAGAEIVDYGKPVRAQGPAGSGAGRGAAAAGRACGGAAAAGDGG